MLPHVNLVHYPKGTTGGARGLGLAQTCRLLHDIHGECVPAVVVMPYQQRTEYHLLVATKIAKKTSQASIGNLVTHERKFLLKSKKKKKNLKM